MNEPNPTKIEISHRTIIFTLIVLVLSYLTYLIADVLVLFFVSFMVSVAIHPLVLKLKSSKVPEGIAIGVVYTIIMLFLIAIIAGIVPPLITETSKLISQIPIPENLATDLKNINLNLQDINTIASQLNSIPKVLGVFGSAFTFMTLVVTIGVMSFYLLKERKNLHKNIMWIFGGNRTEKQSEAFVDRIEKQIGGWVRGEFFLMLAVGLLTYIGLELLNVGYAVPLAIIAGLLEILPNIGPTIAAIPAIAIAFITFQSATMPLAVTALYILIQQLENSFIVPFVMKKAIGINPIATIMLILIGFKLGGVGGAALAIPLFLTIKVVIQEYLKIKKI